MEEIIIYIHTDTTNRSNGNHPGAESEWFALLSQILTNILLFLLIFGMSATVDVKHLRQQVHNKCAKGSYFNSF